MAAYARVHVGVADTAGRAVVISDTFFASIVGYINLYKFFYHPSSKTITMVATVQVCLRRPESLAEMMRFESHERAYDTRLQKSGVVIEQEGLN